MRNPIYVLFSSRQTDKGTGGQTDKKKGGKTDKQTNICVHTHRI